MQTRHADLVETYDASDSHLGTLGKAILQALREGVDLIIMTAHGKRQDFGVRHAENHAERLEWEASFAVDYAVAAIEEAKVGCP